MKNLLLAALLASAAVPALAAEPAEVAPLVVTPLGATADAALVAGPVQTARAEEIERSNALDLTAYMNRTLAGVYINDIQNNPLQPDLNYRGFTASPLLGTPQGLSVYLDGMRLNQPFGDVVSWDLIPRAAIADLTLIPGSNPLFGLNTLGGAVAVRTKDGRSAPGTAVQLGYGSYKRGQVQAETGGQASNGVHWYLTANKLKEDGWREDSPTDANQLFGKVGWSNASTDLAVSLSLADTDLNGNGLQEQRFLERDRGSVYTKPDNTQNRSGFLNFTATHRFSDNLAFSGNAYYRKIATKTYNGDINEESLEETVYQPSAGERAALAAAGYIGFPTAGETAANTPFPFWRCIANGLLNAEPGEKCNGLINRTATDQRDIGFQGQFILTSAIAGRANRLTVGAGYVGGRSHFTQSSQFGYLTPDRGVVGVSGPGAFANGTQDSENAFDARVNLRGRTNVWSLYATDTFSIAEALDLTLSGRFDRTMVKNRDAITPSGPGTLSGDHTFNRFNPAVSLTYNPSQFFGAYVGFNQGSRAPSAIELGCADPENPCRLPNAMAGDPPLKQVVTRTVEAGVRGKLGVGIAWNLGVYRADNHDDILFVADDQAGFGYFKNFGKTRRQGIEVGANAAFGPFSFGANYNFLDATFRSDEEVNGEANSSNSGPAPGFEGEIDIEKGDKIPLIPRHIFKASAQWDVTPKFQLDADMIAVGGVYARGNENNLHRPDGLYYIGPGKTDGYMVFNLGANYRPTRNLKFFFQVNNLFDKTYETAAQLAATGFTETGSFISRPFANPVIDGERPMRNATFYAPGAPRTFWFGVKLRFGQGI